MKPAGQSPVLGYELMQIFQAAGFPSGVVNYLPGSGRDIGEYLVQHPEVDTLAFTGSKEVGANEICFFFG